MGGMVVLSSSGSEARLRWWTHCQAAGDFSLCLPTRNQVVLTRAGFPLIERFFSRTTTLGELAGALAVELGLTQAAVSEARLAELLDELAPAADTPADARQIWAWHQDGLLLSTEVPAGRAESSRARLARAESAIGGAIPTEPWCLLAVAEELARTARPLLKIYLENLFTLSCAAKRFLQALSTRTEVIVRVRDVVEAPRVEAVFRKSVEELIAAGRWTGRQDPPPADWRARQALAEILFGSGVPPLADAQRVRYRHFADLDDELAGIAAQASARLDEGASAATLVIALPDTPAYRARAAATFAGLGARVLVGNGAAAPGELDVIAHADLTGRVCHDLFVAGIEGSADATPLGGGFSADAPENLPTYLLDAFEQSRGPLFLSAVDGTGQAQRDALTRACGNLPHW